MHHLGFQPSSFSQLGQNKRQKIHQQTFKSKGRHSVVSLSFTALEIFNFLHFLHCSDISRHFKEVHWILHFVKYFDIFECQVINATSHDNFTESVLLYHPKPSHHGHSLTCTATNHDVRQRNSMVDRVKLEIYCELLNGPQIALVWTFCKNLICRRQLPAAPRYCLASFGR